MKQKDVESIAKEYAQDKYCTDDNPIPQYKIAQIQAGRDGFIDGYNFRINSVWHKPTEEPMEKLSLLIIEHIDGQFELYFGFDPSVTKRWAYIKDLLSEEEE